MAIPAEGARRALSPQPEERSAERRTPAGEGDGEAATAPPAEAIAANLFAGIVSQWPLLIAALLAGVAGGFLGHMMVGGKRRRQEIAVIARDELDRRLVNYREEVQRTRRTGEQELRSVSERLAKLESAAAPQASHADSSAPAGQYSSQSGSGEPSGTSAVSQRLIDGYNEFLTSPIRARHFNELIWSLGGQALRAGPDGRMTLAPFTGNDANELLVAVPDGVELMVVPSYDYVSEFQSAFGPAIQNPGYIRDSFDLRPDGSGQLRLLKPAVAREDESGWVQLTGKGVLTGFTK
jgi:hypothetical protein